MLMENAGRYVLLPLILKLNEHQLEYRDILTYVALRSFNNAEKHDCFPSYETIAERAGCSRDYIIDSIKRLERADLIKVIRSDQIKVSNKYFFENFHSSVQVPFSIFDTADLSSVEKSILICLRLVSNDTRVLPKDLKTIAQYLGITYQQLYKPFKALSLKGYTCEVLSESKYSSKKSKMLKLTNDKVVWQIILAEKEATEQVLILG